ncbi:UNVERIFIED_CONTAM: Dolichyl-diphosphooligosaccharide--protein glycosyltransferase subunitB [Sesamum angustifolium]|uniref:Dolichyl-diphosphooligosaccharide--protein glycosyltransferase subunit 1 n=1 Tax=Sesamum angustifolium TaxID=2727405 RepID=A0AAW2PS44_9LAMI
MAAIILSLLVLSLSLFTVISSSSLPGLQILQAERQIDLTSHIVRVYLTLKCNYTVTISYQKQATVVKTPSNKVESFTQVESTHRSGNELRYGPYEDKHPYSYSPIIIHFENNNPFAVVEELEREIEVSHWGSVQVTEHYKLAHAGAKRCFLKIYIFAPLIVSNISSTGLSINQDLLLVVSLLSSIFLPSYPRVHSVYYRDDIGNISSSRLRTSSKKSELLIEPRYPLFGGWKATFVIGYGVPLQDFLFESAAGARYLNYSFGCPLVDTVVDKLTIKVVLPEGSQNPSVEVPFAVEQSLETKYSYLDVIGRKVVVLEKKNVVLEHNVPFQVHYKFNPIFMLAEPLMLASAFFLFFITCVAYLHIDLSLRK